MITPAEFGESHTSSLSSALRGTSPKEVPSRRMYAHLRSVSHGTWSDGPMWTDSELILRSIWLVTDCVFEIFFEIRRSRSSMFMKSMFPPKFSWYVLSILTPRSSKSRCKLAVNDRRADLGLDVVTDDRQTGVDELLGPLLIRGDEHRDCIDERYARLESGIGVELGRLLGADRQVGNEYVGTRVLERLHNVDRLLVGFLDHPDVVRAKTVECWASHDVKTQITNLGELDGVVL